MDANATQSPQQGQESNTNDAPSPAPPVTHTETPVDIATQMQKKQRNEELRALSRTFGPIPDVPIFSTWDKRLDCCNAAVHRSVMSGIVGNARVGVYSIVLASSYKDDEDGGNVVIYTGAGGRQRWTDTIPPKRIRLGPQTQDQTWETTSNKALIVGKLGCHVSCLTGYPIRVIRSWRCPSRYAPLQGYRYDGLYQITAYWTAKGQNGKDVCRCRLERLPDQPPIPLRPMTISTSKRRRRERLVSEPDLPCASSSAPLPSNGGEPESLSDPSQRSAIPEAFSQSDPNTNCLDMKESLWQIPSQHTRSTLDLEALPRYKWDSKKKQLVKIPAFGADPENAEVHEEGHRGEDDASTLVPSEASSVVNDIVT